MTRRDGGADRHDVAARPLRNRLEDTFWERHANPWSGWSRVAVSPVLVYAIYRREWRLLAAAVVFTAVRIPSSSRGPRGRTTG